MVNVSVELWDGSYHEVDSNEMAFKIAASMAIQDACRQAKPVILEPMMKVEVVTPDKFMGDVTGNLSSKRGLIEGMEDRGMNKDRKSTRLNSSHLGISYAVFCLKKNKRT